MKRREFLAGAAALAACSRSAEALTRAQRTVLLAGATKSSNPYLLFDTFSRYADNTVMSGQIPQVGPAWQTTGSSIPTISGGKLINTETIDNGIGYLFNQLSAVPSSVTTELDWTGGTDMTFQGMTIAYSSDTTFTLSDLLHLNFAPDGFELTIRQSAGNFDDVVVDNWQTAMANDGTTYAVSLQVQGNQCVIVGPSGEKWSISDSRISSVAGKFCFWEPSLSDDGLQAHVSKAYAAKTGVFGYTDYAPLNPSDQVNMTLQNVNCQTTAGANAVSNQVRTVAANSNQKVYFEVRCPTIFNPDQQIRAFGISNAAHTLSTRPGDDGDSFSFVIGSTVTFQALGGPFASFGSGSTTQADQGDVIAIAIDFGAQLAWYRNITKNSGWNGDVIANQNPATGVGGMSFDGLAAGPYFISLYTFQIADSYWLNTGNCPYAGAAPAGFSNWLS